MLQDSFAIYASDKCEIDVHINVWTNMKSANYIDIGLRIYKKENFNTISIYVPYCISQNDICDLSEIFCKNPQNLVEQRITPHFLTADHPNYYEFTTKG